ncbi:hypothetical protein RI129_010377 [Pyrocoelia pectoralis]|uniref:Uncharacterized protein n=1 Tax=Pyrocoelia pectoralis TaxID=417401 RepID=A0AAN7V4F8_9COLE
MVEETESRGPRTETVKRKLKDGYTIPLLSLVTVTLIVLCSVFYGSTTSESEGNRNVSVSIEEQEFESIARVRIRSQPNCTMKEYIFSTLCEISSELYIRKTTCAPEDVNDLLKHAVPTSKKKSREPRGNSVIYIAVGLLLTSLMVAFLDVYKVKGKPSKSKPQLTKRCSLADLTVLRHSRRESMKKDSMMDEHRVPLKLLGARPLPESRRCSVPYQVSDVSYGNMSPRRGSRKCSLDDVSADSSYNRVRLVRRF